MANTNFKLKDIKILTNIALSSIKRETFLKSFRHSLDIGSKYWENDGLSIMPIINETVIDLEETDTDSGGSSSESE